jgi:type I site-specific restriction endonuclease
VNEAETRAELIDPALKTAGWGVIEGFGRELSRTVVASAAKLLPLVA